MARRQTILPLTFMLWAVQGCVYTPGLQSSPPSPTGGSTSGGSTSGGSTSGGSTSGSGASGSSTSGVSTTTGGNPAGTTTGAPPPLPAIQVVQTAGDKSVLLAAQHNQTFQLATNSNFGTDPVIALDPCTTYQTMDGFGASLTDSAAYLIWYALNSSQQKSLMQEFFSPTLGIGLSFLRQPMGASDFSASGNYSYDDVSSGTDVDLAEFSIAHDQVYIIPLLQQALTLNTNLHMMATPWSPPAWMKATQAAAGTMNGGTLNASYNASFAQYFVKFIKAYSAEHLPIYAVAAQNEPENNNPNYPTSTLTEDAEATFVSQYLGPALAAAQLPVKIFGYEHNWGDTNFPLGLLSDAQAAPYLAGTSFHCYSGDVTAQSTVEAAYPDKGVWFTECSGSVGSSFSGDLVYNSANLLIGATRNWARAVSLWNLALDQNSQPTNGGCSNCRGVVTIDTTTSPATITRNVEYYVLAHLAAFVRPGAVRIDSPTFSNSGLEDVAFQNADGSTAVFVLNSTSAAISFVVTWRGYAFSYNLPATSVATFSWQAWS